MKTACLLIVFGLIAVSPAIAEPKPYIDNRSDAAELVRSFYNAIDRREFARAWSYFGDKKPAKDVAELARSFEGASRVEVMVGTMSTVEDAKGSDHRVSASIVVKSKNADKYKDSWPDKDPDEKNFTGCITVHLAKSSDGSFVPMRIEQLDLKSEKDFSHPQDCDAAAKPVTAMRARVLKAFADTYADCPTLGPDAREDVGPEEFELTYRYSYDQPENPDRHATLYRFSCGSGAYNSSDIFYLADDDRLQPLQFTHPEYDVQYEGPLPVEREGTADPSIVKSITITGYQSEDSLANTEFTPETQTLTFKFLGRGMGDQFVSGEYVFREGEFRLVKYEIDDTDNEVVDPITVIDLVAAPIVRPAFPTKIDDR